MDYPTRRRRLADRLPELEVEAMLVTRLPNVRYLTGFSGSNGQLVLTADAGTFLTDGRYAEQTRHEVADLDRDIYASGFVPAFVQACKGLRVRRIGFETGGVTYRMYTDLAETGLDMVPIRDEIEGHRWVKEPAEVEMIRAAQAIADQAFTLICDRLAEGVTEQEAALELDTVMRSLGAEGLAFETIMAFGESSAEPHHHPTARPLSRGDLVKMDFGCIVGGYHSDMTRTVAYGEPAQELREVYEVVRRAQQAGVDAVRAGVSGHDADRAARDLIVDAGFREEFRHSLGHGVGLEIHEGPYLRVGSEDELPAGSVVTVEPGVYLDGRGGVRIEDMVEVTDDGAVVIPSTTKELVVL